MAKLSKRMQAIREKVDADKAYDAVEALDLLKSLSSVKFTESVEEIRSGCSRRFYTAKRHR